MVSVSCLCHVSTSKYTYYYTMFLYIYSICSNLSLCLLLGFAWVVFSLSLFFLDKTLCHVREAITKDDDLHSTSFFVFLVCFPMFLCVPLILLCFTHLISCCCCCCCSPPLFVCLLFLFDSSVVVFLLLLLDTIAMEDT